MKFVASQLTEQWLRERIAVTSSGCWLWNGGRDKNGYGYTRINYQKIAGHRAAWMLYRGMIPPGAFICHRCDVPACCNPDHLFLGDAKSNNWDAFNKGRREWPKNTPATAAHGERNCNAKLTRELVLFIRSSPLTSIALSKMINVTHGNIRKVRRGELWRHV